MALTENEWQTCKSPDPLFFDRLNAVGGLTRKLQLWGCGAARLVLSFMDDPRSRHAVEIAERYADGLATASECASAHEDAMKVWDERFPNRDPETDSEFAVFVAFQVIACPSDNWAGVATLLARTGLPSKLEERFWQNVEMLADLLRDVFGNPFRPVRTEERWLTPQIIELAGLIYEQRTFDRMAALGNLIHDAGCNEPAIIDHCKNTPIHIRGCWLVDLLLNKNDTLLHRGAAFPFPPLQRNG
jgi:hypothetical protein